MRNRCPTSRRAASPARTQAVGSLRARVVAARTSMKRRGCRCRSRSFARASRRSSHTRSSRRAALRGPRRGVAPRRSAAVVTAAVAARLGRGAARLARVRRRGVRRRGCGLASRGASPAARAAAAVRRRPRAAARRGAATRRAASRGAASWASVVGVDVVRRFGGGQRVGRHRDRLGGVLDLVARRRRWRRGAGPCGRSASRPRGGCRPPRAWTACRRCRSARRARCGRCGGHNPRRGAARRS